MITLIDKINSLQTHDMLWVISHNKQFECCTYFFKSSGREMAVSVAHYFKIGLMSQLRQLTQRMLIFSVFVVAWVRIGLYFGLIGLLWLAKK